MESKDTEEIDDGYEPLTQEEIDELICLSQPLAPERFTEEELSEDEDLQEKLRDWFLKVFDQWRTTGADKAELNFILDKMPAEWIANTYTDRFKFIKWEEEKYCFAEQIVLPYCIKKGILVKKKGAKDYEYVGENFGRMQELDF